MGAAIMVTASDSTTISSCTNYTLFVFPALTTLTSHFGTFLADGEPISGVDTIEITKPLPIPEITFSYSITTHSVTKTLGFTIVMGRIEEV